jgi:hypothetical protein
MIKAFQNMDIASRTVSVGAPNRHGLDRRNFRGAALVTVPRE